MEDSPTSDARGARRTIMEDDDEESASSEKGQGQPMQDQAAEGGGGGGGGGGVLGGTGLSSDSEDGEGSGAENGSKGAPREGDDGGVGGDGGKDDGANSAMKDLFGEDEEEEDEEDEDAEQPASAGGAAGGGGGAGGSGGGRYGAAGGGSSDDEDMFGEGGGITARSGTTAPASSNYGGGGIPRGGSSDEEDEELEAPPTPLEDRKLKIPVLPRPPAGADVMVSRLPNILGVKTEAFDPDTYDEEAEADEFKFTTNIIRWRHKRGNLGRPELGDDGRALRESNTRLVRWSDGSTQLLVGDEAFDVGEHSIDRSALFVQQMTDEGSVLQCQGELTKKMSFKPSNVLSKAHRTLTLAVRKRAVKGSRIKKYAETIDPEQVKQERARAEEAMHKQARRKNRVYRQYNDEGGASGRRSAMNIDYLEEGAFDDTSMRAIKNDSRAGRYDDGGSSQEDNGGINYDDDSDEEDQNRGLEALQAKKAEVAAAKAAATARANAVLGTDSEEEEEEEEDEDEAREGRGGGKGKGSSSSRGSMANDEEEEEEEEEEDDDSEDGRGARKRSRAPSLSRQEEGSTPARAGKRSHRSITEDSSESD